MMNPILHPLFSNHPHLIRHSVPLKDKNWFKTGGPAKLFAEPGTPEEFQLLYEYTQAVHEPVFILGSGANILISDKGFDGLVIKPQLNSITLSLETSTQALIKAGAGTTMDELILFCLAHNLLGLEEFSGIPGTVGGSVFINLHYFEFLLSQFLVEATVLEKSSNQLLTVDNAWFNFGYNISTLHAGNHFLLDATFQLKKATSLQTSHAYGRRKEIIRHRAKRYPTHNTCGSFFRNFHESEVHLTQNGKKIIWVAYYLDKIGIKGHLQQGNAAVSYQHANMIVNHANASTHDIITVARLMQEGVQKEFGITPQPECRLVGFKEYPLL
jgi:UDP-N-acetylmuramate dehydrogenase